MPYSPELQRRLDSDPALHNISILGVDPGMMPTKITTGPLSLLGQLVIFVLSHIASRVWPSVVRLPHKSARDVVAAAFGTDPPLSERPKGLYLNGTEKKHISAETRDPEKRASVRHAGLREGGTCLID